LYYCGGSFNSILKILQKNKRRENEQNCGTLHAVFRKREKNVSGALSAGKRNNGKIAHGAS
jgi:hypothetical protein